MKKIYVGNLPWTAMEEDVREFFSEYGDVGSVAIIVDRETGRSRGFGFVEMEDSEADHAIEEANGQSLGGRTLRVNEAQERRRESGPPRGRGDRDYDDR